MDSTTHTGLRPTSASSSLANALHLSIGLERDHGVWSASRVTMFPVSRTAKWVTWSFDQQMEQAVKLRVEQSAPFVTGGGIMAQHSGM